MGNAVTYFHCLPSTTFESGGRIGSHILLVIKNAAENELLQTLPSKAFTDLCSGL
jgi:hypothetical protein